VGRCVRGNYNDSFGSTRYDLSATVFRHTNTDDKTNSPFSADLIAKLLHRPCKDALCT